MSRLPQYREGTTNVILPTNAPRFGRAVVEVLNAKATPKERELTRGSLVLGAGLAADVVIDDMGVSRRHAQITLTELGVEVLDLESRNGTFYQGQRIKRIVLDRDGTIQLGSVHLSVRVEANDARLPGHEHTRFGSLLGGCPSMQRVIGTLERLRDSTVPLLIVGESGTGKEVLARAVHEHSRARDGAFVAVNCSALNHESARAELFGVVGQSISAPNEVRLGAFAAARGGTLFLDEIGDLPLTAQPLLLPVLECVEAAVGSDIVREGAPARVIAATQRDLPREVEAGRFRHDLYHRLNVVQIELPPLRERGNDIVLLARQFAAEFDVRYLTTEVIDRLCKYRWPGNVRELRNVLRGYAAVGALPEPNSKDPADGFAHLLRSALDLELPYQAQKERLVNQFIEIYLTELLHRTHGNQSAAARIAGLDRAHLNKMLARLRTVGSTAGRSEPPRDPEL